MPYFKRTGYSNFKNVRTFKKTSLGTHKYKPFHKKYYHKNSSNSATTKKGKFIKLVETATFTSGDFKQGRANVIIFSSHLPMAYGPAFVS